MIFFSLQDEGPITLVTWVPQNRQGKLHPSLTKTEMSQKQKCTENQNLNPEIGSDYLGPVLSLFAFQQKHLEDALELEETQRLTAEDKLQVTIPDGLGQPSWKGD